MGEISPRKVSSSSFSDQVGPFVANTLAGVQIRAILAMVSSLLQCALAVIAWSSYLTFWRAIANSISIYLTIYFILEIVLILNAIGFVLPEAKSLAKIAELAQVVANIIMTSWE